MSVEVIRDVIGRAGDTRYLQYEVPVNDFRWIFSTLQRARALWERSYYANYGPHVLSLSAALEEGIIKKPEDFRPTLEMLSGPVSIPALGQTWDHCYMTLAGESHSGESWLGYIWLRSLVQDKSIQLSPSIPNKLELNLPVGYSEGYSGEAIYEEVAKAFTAFSKG
jgi:hypothetical protein